MEEYKRCVIEILTEEPSMEYFLRGILPRILPDDFMIDVNCFIRVYPESRASSFIKQKKYRNPDLLHGADELNRLTKNFSKSQAAREISQYIDVNNNTSPSFNHTIKAIRQLCILN